MVLYRFFFAPAVLAAAVWVGHPRHAPAEPLRRPAATTAAALHPVPASAVLPAPGRTTAPLAVPRGDRR